ncbi:molybdopterin-synthase adenylyltransferase MoeB [Ruegeria sp. 2012CJ41-6]|uniref:Molybdopterin-synthase adenylyltransferase MoeB n=1 Tax=Ruegeria spongiae TaxID=2942209 RepID=A0ABT0PZ85_9RHOB|nr:molybdopterin-synthase adenylyltransferase MoeB [Ruegeria spongiae]MCL6282939.1 molybdopterin-synthase adenylyltransferase MoeB [Ruegeria spongiae]
MLLVFAVAAALWGLGWVLDVPRRSRIGVVAGLFLVVICLQLLLPDGHPVREMTGTSPALWLLLAGFGAVAVFYGRFVSGMRAKVLNAEREGPAKPGGAFSDTELERYARHIVLRELGGPGQKRLKQARVLVIGAGGLGAPALQYLAAAGAATIGVIDDDVVENANLQRQVIHRDADIGMPKVFSAKQAMEAQNPNVVVRPYHRRLTEEIAAELFADYDLILDGSDNFDTRYLANRVAVAQGKPLISGALSQWEGQISVFDPQFAGPCYQCIFPEAPAAGLAPSCAEAGVIGPLPGVIGSMMALEAIKVITGAGAPLRGEMLIYDGLYGETRKIALKRRDDCPVCGAA